MKLKSRIYIKVTAKLQTNLKQNEKWKNWFQTEAMENQILKSFKMSSDSTEWHDVAAGRRSLCDWMMEGARYFSEISNLGRC